MIKPRTKPRRGRVIDKAYLAWIHTQPCIVTGEMPVTAHHVRRFGEQKNDRRTVPLVDRLHMLTHEKRGQPCVERGKKIFQEFWGVDLEEEVQRYNARYEQLVQTGRLGQA